MSLKLKALNRFLLGKSLLYELGVIHLQTLGAKLDHSVSLGWYPQRYRSTTFKNTSKKMHRLGKGVCANVRVFSRLVENLPVCLTPLYARARTLSHAHKLLTVTLLCSYASINTLFVFYPNKITKLVLCNVN